MLMTVGVGSCRQRAAVSDLIKPLFDDWKHQTSSTRNNNSAGREPKQNGVSEKRE